MNYVIIGEILPYEMDDLVKDQDPETIQTESLGEGRGRMDIEVFKIGETYFRRVEFYGFDEWITRYELIELI